jgi:osmotically-inducible protein OsmY
MAQPLTTAARPDVDIVESIMEIIAHYPPLAADRPHLKIGVQSGHVVLSGHVRTPITRRYLLERVAEVADVTGVDSDHLYDEESIRLEVGAALPDGVMAAPRYGTVILTGALPGGDALDALIQRVGSVRGVDRIITRQMPS